MGKDLKMPIGWIIIKVDSIGNLFRGITYKKDDAITESKEGFLPILRANNINGELNFDDLVYVPEKTVHEDQKIQNCDVIFAMSSGSKHLVGKSAVAKSNFNGSCGAFCSLLRIDDTVNKKYIAYIFKGSSYRKMISEIAKGTNINNLKREHILDFEIPLPPLPEQHRIVAKIETLFSSLDKGIESLKTAQQQLKIYRQAVLKWAFEGKLTHDNVKDGELPDGWKWVKIEDVSFSLDNQRKPINKNERLKRHGNFPYYGANGRIGWIDDYIFDEPLICVVEDETFIGRQIPFSYKIVGKTWVNNHAHVLKPKNDINLDFLNYQLSYYPFLSLTTGTTGRKKLTKNALMNAPIKICTFPEQHAIVSEIESRLSVCDKLEESITHSLKQAEALRQSILKKAFEGRLVPHDPDDEPASNLLERIRAEKEKNRPEQKIRAKKAKK